MKRLLAIIAIFALFFAQLAGLTFVANASILSSATIALSNQGASASSEHTVTFVTGSGVDSNSDTIVVEYEAGFDLTNLSAPDDFDLAVDDDAACDGAWTDKTLAASAAAGTWGVAVSGQSITFTAPTDAVGGEIAGGRCVQIQIGTNAASASENIVNPSSAASYEVDVYGTFGDRTMFAVGIASVGSFTVTATLPRGSSFLPTADRDLAGPTISNVVVQNITETSASITWETNELAEYVIDYGQTNTYGRTVVDGSWRNIHSAGLGGLTGGTEYHARITATDLNGNSTVSTDITFTTIDQTGPVLANPEVVSQTETTITLVWETDEPSSSSVTVLETGQIFTNNTLSTEHVIELTDLPSDTTLTLIYSSTDAQGNTSESSTEATTLEDIAPANPTGIAARPGINSITLTWKIPSEIDFAAVALVYNPDHTPTSPADGVWVYNGRNEIFTHVGLEANQEHFYTLFAYDVNGNLSSGTSISAIPLAAAPDPVEEISEEDLAVPTEPNESNQVQQGPTTTPTAYPLPPVTSNSPTSTTTQTSPIAPTGGSSTTSTVSGGGAATSGAITDTHLTVLAARDTIVLSPLNGEISILAGRTLGIQLDTQAVGTQVANVDLYLGSTHYLMNPVMSVETTPDGNTALRVRDVMTYRARIVGPTTSERMHVVITYHDGSVQTLRRDLHVVGSGIVRAENMEAAEGIEGAIVTLLTSDGSIWSSTSYFQANPLQTGSTGTFAWYVPNGTYRVRATANGYAHATGALTQVDDNIFAQPLDLMPRLIPLDEKLDEIFREEHTFVKKIGLISALVAERAGRAVRLAQESEEIERAAEVTVVTVAATTTITATSLAVGSGLFTYLQFLLTAPLQLLNRRRRKDKWGIVYDSIKKVPVDLAIVRLYDMATNKIVRTAVTDRQGRYLFMVGAGEYRIEVQKPGYLFPTTVLAGKLRDGVHTNIYDGSRTLKVLQREESIGVNIPIDVEGEAKVPWHIIAERWFNRTRSVLSLAGLALALTVVILFPTLLHGLVLLAQVLIYALFRRLAQPPKPPNWGRVYDNKSRRPLPRVVVRVFDPTFNKLLETQVTDGNGRYAFLVGPNEYYSTYQRKGYEELEVRPIDRTDSKETSYISLDIGLTPTKRSMKNKNTNWPLKRAGAALCLVLCTVASVGLWVRPARAALDVPQIINYQGRLTDDSRITVTDGSYNMKFAIYDASSGGNCLWSMGDNDADTATIECTGNTPDNAVSVTVTDGIFSVLLGDSSVGNVFPDTLFDDNATLYLGVTIASDSEMSPRKRLAANAYAIQAGDADLLDSLNTDNDGCTSACVPVTTADGNIIFTGDPQSTAISGGTVYVNPAAPDAGEIILGVANNGTARFSVDAEGDVIIGTGTPSVATGGGALYATGAIEGDAGLNIAGAQSVSVEGADADAIVFLQKTDFSGSLGASRMHLGQYTEVKSTVDPNSNTYQLVGHYIYLEENGSNIDSDDGDAYGLYAVAKSNEGGGFSTENLRGVWGSAIMDGAGDVNQLIGVRGDTSRTAGTVNSGYGGYFVDSAATSNGFGVFGEANSASATNNYGGYFLAKDATNNYAIFTEQGYVHIENTTWVAPTMPNVGNNGTLFVRHDVEIYDGALCVGDGVTDDCSDVAGTDGTVYAVASSVSGHDLAERFPSMQTLLPGEIVSASPDGSEHVQRTKEGDIILGAITTAPGVILGRNEDWQPVALAGRTPVLVNGEGGAIEIGDRITISSVPGVGKKAQEAGEVVGIAMESYDGVGDGSVMTFMHPHYWHGQELQSVTNQEISSTVSAASILSASSSRLTNLLSLAAMNWRVGEDGIFATRGRYDVEIESTQAETVRATAVLSVHEYITLAGSTAMQGNEAFIEFEAIAPQFNDIIDPGMPYVVTATMSGGTGSVYVAQKNEAGFTLRRNDGNSTQVDWHVTAFRLNAVPEPVEVLSEEETADEEESVEETVEEQEEEAVEEATEESSEEVVTTEEEEVVEEPAEEEVIAETTEEESAVESSEESAEEIADAPTEEVAIEESSDEEVVEEPAEEEAVAETTEEEPSE